MAHKARKTEHAGPKRGRVLSMVARLRPSARVTVGGGGMAGAQSRKGVAGIPIISSNGRLTGVEPDASTLKVLGLRWPPDARAVGPRVVGPDHRRAGEALNPWAGFLPRR